jgi:hypothetical protein
MTNVTYIPGTDPIVIGWGTRVGSTKGRCSGLLYSLSLLA